MFSGDGRERAEAFGRKGGELEQKLMYFVIQILSMPLSVPPASTLALGADHLHHIL